MKGHKSVACSSLIQQKRWKVWNGTGICCSTICKDINTMCNTYCALSLRYLKALFLFTITFSLKIQQRSFGVRYSQRITLISNKLIKKYSILNTTHGRHMDHNHQKAIMQWDEVKWANQTILYKGNTGFLNSVIDWALRLIAPDSSGKKSSQLKPRASLLESLGPILRPNLTKLTPKQGSRTRFLLSFHQSLWENLSPALLSPCNLLLTWFTNDSMCHGFYLKIR